MKLRLICVLACAVAASAPQAAEKTAATGAAQVPKTVGDLQQRPVDVRPQAPLAGSAARAMENYQKFLDLQNTDPKLRAEALRRLGDLNLESGELERLSNEVNSIDVQGAEAIRLYSVLLKAYPDYARNDAVLYQLARAYETTGQSTQALATLDGIVQRYPNSREMGEVQFRRGELLFSAKRYADAQAAYAAVIARGKSGSSFFEQALYKHGWSQFKQGLNEDSLGSFSQLLDQKLLGGNPRAASRSLDTLGRADRELVDDTLRVMSISFSYLDGSMSIDQLLMRRGPASYAWLLYSRLGDLYVEKERYQDAAAAYRAFVARDPVDEHSPGLSMQAIEAYRKGGFTDLVVEGKTEYVNEYAFGTAFWSQRRREDFPQVVAELKTNLKDLSQHHHAQAQKSKKPEDYALAARWYGERLKFFPDDADAADTNYMLAEVLFESRQYVDATAQYERSAYDYPVGPRSSAAGYAALVAYQKQEETLPAAQKPAWHARATESALRFASTFPQHPESAGVLTRAAQDLFAARDLQRAMVASQQLLARNPPVDEAKQRIAWTIIGQSQYDLGAFDQSELALTRALAVTGGAAAERADVTERLAAAVYKQGETKRKNGDEAGSAEDFLRVARLAPASKVVPTAQYDAAAALVNSKQWDRAISVLEDYRRAYPKTEYGADITRKLAVAYVEAGKPAQAAGEFERIAGSANDDPAVNREALMRAADLYESAGNTSRSAALLEQFVQKYPAPVSDAMEVRFRLAEVARKTGNGDRLQYWRNELVKGDAAAGGGRTDRTRYLAAHARLALAAPARDAFRAVKLTAPIKQSLVKKRQALDQSLRDYQAVASYNVADTTTAATFEMAELYRTLARDLMASERPKKLSRDEREQYDALLEEQAFPIEEQSIGLHELNAARAPEGVYDESVQQSFKALAELKPARYGKTELAPAGNGSAAAAAATAEGIALRQAGKFAEARAAYERAIASDPDYAPAHRDIAVLLDLYLNHPVEALPEFEKYRELSGEDKPVTGWIAELRARTGIKAPQPAAPAAPADPAPVAAPAATEAP